tara:strand:- start:49 stop:426 length:378 start_codon:yes stop_codon:yes gene_type:complete
MATKAQWTVVMDDRKVINHNVKNDNGVGTGYTISDNDFWGLAKWSNVWAIQYGTPNPSDTVEYRDETPHSTWEDANLGDFQDFITKWDSAHLAQLQSNWDDDNVTGESESDKIARLGARPTSFSS